MITTVKIVRAHAKALYWKHRTEAAERNMRKNLEILAEVGSGKHETENGFFTVSENNSYPPEEVRKHLSEADAALCYEKRWSNQRARVLFPEVMERVRVRNGYKVSI